MLIRNFVSWLHETLATIFAVVREVGFLERHILFRAQLSTAIQKQNFLPAGFRFFSADSCPLFPTV